MVSLMVFLVQLIVVLILIGIACFLATGLYVLVIEPELKQAQGQSPSGISLENPFRDALNREHRHMHQDILTDKQMTLDREAIEHEMALAQKTRLGKIDRKYQQ